MVARKIAVLGASGHTGRVVAEKLIGLGHEVRAVCRDQKKLDTLVKLGAKPYPVDIDHQVPALLEAFRDVDAVYTMIPPNYGVEHYLRYEDRVGEHIVTALKEAGTEWVVNLSSLGAELTSGTGPIVGLHRQEERLDQIDGLNVMHLRPAYFMDNLLSWIPYLRKNEKIGSALRPDLPVDMVAAADVGKKAAALLDGLEFAGHGVLEVCGPRAYRIDEAVKLCGKAIGKPDLRYVEVENREAEKVLVAAGFELGVAKLFLEFERAVNEGLIELHGEPFKGAITLEKWAIDTFAPAFKALA